MADVTVPRGYIGNFVSQLHDLDQMGRTALEEALGRTDLGNRDRVRAIMRVHCNASAEAATQLSAQFYRGLSLIQTGRDASVRISADYDEVATDVAVNAIMRDNAGDPEKLARALGDRLSYETNRASKRGVWKAGQADGRKVRYARVPQGTETCAWCLMTAGLGFWFMTEESASHTHRGCDCAIIAEIGGIHDVSIEGYDSTVYRDMWREARRLLDNGEVPQELLDRINAEKAAKGSRYRIDTNGTLAVMRYLYDLK